VPRATPEEEITAVVDAPTAAATNDDANYKVSRANKTIEKQANHVLRHEALTQISCPEKVGPLSMHISYEQWLMII